MITHAHLKFREWLEHHSTFLALPPNSVEVHFADSPSEQDIETCHEPVVCFRVRGYGGWVTEADCVLHAGGTLAYIGLCRVLWPTVNFASVLVMGIDVLPPMSDELRRVMDEVERATGLERERVAGGKPYFGP